MYHTIVYVKDFLSQGVNTIQDHYDLVWLQLGQAL